MIKRILKLKKDINYIKNGYRTFIEFNFKNIEESKIFDEKEAQKIKDKIFKRYWKYVRKNIICNKRTTVKELNERKILTEMDLEMAKLQIEFMRKLKDEQPI